MRRPFPVFTPVIPSHTLPTSSIGSRIRLSPRSTPPPPSHLAPAISTSLPPSSSPRLPFFRDPSHTIPTKWSLYRPLLRAVTAAYPSLTPHLRAAWRKERKYTSIPRARDFLRDQHRFLDDLGIADTAAQARINSRVEQAHEELSLAAAAAAQAVADAEAEAAKAPRPRLTGAFHRPSLFNPPLPRIKPQPLALSMMIHRRVMVRERRVQARQTWAERMVDMRREVAFWRELGVDDGNTSLGAGSWETEARLHVRELDAQFQREHERANSIFDDVTIERVYKARARRDAARRARAKARASGAIRTEDLVDRGATPFV